jgi:hypothetical protein
MIIAKGYKDIFKLPPQYIEVIEENIKAKKIKIKKL